MSKGARTWASKLIKSGVKPFVRGKNPGSEVFGDFTDVEWYVEPYARGSEKLYCIQSLSKKLTCVKIHTKRVMPTELARTEIVSTTARHN